MGVLRGVGSLAATAIAAGLSTGACTSDLTDDLSGRPCEEGECLPGYACDVARNVCVEEGTIDGARDGSARGSGGNTGGTGNVDGAAGSGAAGGSMGGTGGAPPDAGGASGAASDGRAVDVTVDATTRDVAADAPTAESGTPDASPPEAGPSRTVTCRAFDSTYGDVCDLGAAEFCCVESFPFYPDLPPPSGFSCRTGSTAGCEWQLSCDGDHDCPVGQSCCAAQFSGSNHIMTCAPDCSGNIHVECTKPEHCPSGQYCCGFVDSSTRYSEVVCRDDCSASADRELCNSAADCIQVDDECIESTLLPGFTACRASNQ